MPQLTLDLYRDAHSLLVNNKMQAVEVDKPSGWSAMQQFCLTAPALPLEFAVNWG